MTKSDEAPKKQISTQVSAEDHSKLEGYAYGTRRRISTVLKEAVSEYLKNHEKDIKEKSV